MRIDVRSLRLATAGILCVACTLVSVHANGAVTPIQVLGYQVTRSFYGSIGTYENRIQHEDDTTVVQTRVHFLITILGIVLHRQDADRVERWKSDRLVSFHGSTDLNGSSSTVDGETRPEGFAITTAKGTVLAPATVRPSNPWSAGFLKSNTIMLSDSGLVETISVSAQRPSIVKIIGKRLQTREYAISAAPRYRVRVDDRDVPVKFDVDDETGLVTFTLTERSTPC